MPETMDDDVRIFVQCVSYVVIMSHRVVVNFVGHVLTIDVKTF